LVTYAIEIISACSDSSSNPTGIATLRTVSNSTVLYGEPVRGCRSPSARGRNPSRPAVEMISAERLSHAMSPASPAMYSITSTEHVQRFESGRMHQHIRRRQAGLEIRRVREQQRCPAGTSRLCR
jgi:hypothetical protein